MADFSLPRLVVRAGLTGHRPDRLAIPAALVTERVGLVLDSMARAARAVGAEAADLYQPTEPLLRFTSGLARGTDEIGAGAALAKGWQLQSIIAFSRQRFADLAVAECPAEEAAAYRRRYMALLHRSQSVLEIMGSEAGGLRRDGYELVGEVLLKQSDVLIGVWDGKPARGLGGSSHLMRMALQRGLPVVWIHATRAEEAMQVYLPGQGANPDLGLLTAWLCESLRLGGRSTALPNITEEVRRRWSEFVGEQGNRAGRFVPLFQYLLMLGGKGRPSWPLDPSESAAHWKNNWDQFRHAVRSADPVIAARMDEVLWRPFLRADHLAERYGRAYRGTYVLIYLLAALATIAGLSGLIFHHAKPWLVATELAMIVFMAGVAWIGHRNRWHQRCLEYRAVAEQLRQARMGIWTGRSVEPSAPEGDSSHAGASWVSWYIRACVRQLPLVNVAATPQYVCVAVNTINHLEVEEQRRFNTATSRVQEHVHERLRAFEIGLFSVLVLACAGFLLIYSLDIHQFRTDFNAHTLEHTGSWTRHLPNLMTFIGALIPALGAALLGMRSQGDFTAYAERTADTAAQLQAIAEVIEHRRKMGADELDFEDLLELEDRTTVALANDVFAWRMVYRRKPLTISA